MEEYIKEQIVLWDSLCKGQSDFYHRAAVWSGLSDAAYWIMYSVCWKEETISQSELCAENYFSKQTVNSAVTKLVKLGLVTLEVSGENRKRKRIQFTTSGKKFCDQYVQPILQIESDTFKEFPRDEIDQMLTTMEKQLDIMKEKADQIWQ